MWLYLTSFHGYVFGCTLLFHYPSSWLSLALASGLAFYSYNSNISCLLGDLTLFSSGLRVGSAPATRCYSLWGVITLVFLLS